MDKNRIIHIAKRIGRSVLVMFSFMYVQFACYDAVHGHIGHVTFWTDRAKAILIVCICFLAYWVFADIFASTDKKYKDRYFEGDVPRLSFKRKIGFTLSAYEFWCELAVTFLFLFLMPTDDGVLHSLSVILGSEEAPASPMAAIVAAVPLFFVFATIAHYSCCNTWIKEERSRKRRKSNKKEMNPTVKCIVFELLCLFSFAMFPIVAMDLIPMIYVFRKIIPIVLAIGIFIAILSTAVRYFKAIRKRKCFASDFAKICESLGYTYSEPKHLVHALFFEHDGKSFSFSAEGKVYDCKIMHCINPHSYMIFDANGRAVIGTDIKIRGIKLFSFATEVNYSYESVNEKLLLICPVPRDMYLVENGRTRLLDVGDKVGEYKIYNASGFLNALERKCLDR